MTTTKLSGKLANGTKWDIDTYTGEVEIYGRNAAGEMEWLVPCMESLSEAEQDELASIGSDLNHLALEEKAKKFGEYYGSIWMDNYFFENELEEMNWDEFSQMLVNANDPAFYGDDDIASAVEEIFGDITEEDMEAAEEMCESDHWLGMIIEDAAKDSAWDALQKRLEEESENA